MVNDEYFVPIADWFIIKDSFVQAYRAKRSSSLNYITESKTTVKIDGQTGSALFSAGNVIFEADGSGQVAGGNLIWDALGNLSMNGDVHSENAYIKGEIHGTSGTFNGKVTSNINGNRIEIDPNTRTIKMIDKFSSVLVEMGFYDYGGNETGAEIVYKSYDQNRNISSSMRVLGGTIALYHGDIDQAYNYASIFHDGKTRLNLDPDQIPNRNEAHYGDTYLEGEALKVKRS